VNPGSVDFVAVDLPSVEGFHQLLRAHRSFLLHELTNSNRKPRLTVAIEPSEYRSSTFVSLSFAAALFASFCFFIARLHVLLLRLGRRDNLVRSALFINIAPG